MSLIVDKDAHFEVRFPYRELKNSHGRTVGVDILDHAENECQWFEARFIPANFEEMGVIREESTIINQIDAKPMLMLRQFCPKVISIFCKEWNLADERGDVYPIHENVVRCLHEHFVIKIIEEWARKTGYKDLINDTGTHISDD